MASCGCVPLLQSLGSSMPSTKPKVHNNLPPLPALLLNVEEANLEMRDDICDACRSGHRKVLLLGRPGVGKSSFINSAASALAGRHVVAAATGGTGAGGHDNFTLRRFRYAVPCGDGRTALDVYDVPGSEFDDLMAGKTNDDEFVAGLVRDGISCIVFTESMQRVSAADTGLDAAGMTKGLYVLQQLYRKCGNQERPIKMIAVLTHCDEVKPAVMNNPTGLHNSIKVNAVVKSFASKAGLPPLQVFPVVNLVHPGKEQEPRFVFYQLHITKVIVDAATVYLAAGDGSSAANKPKAMGEGLGVHNGAQQVNKAPGMMMPPSAPGPPPALPPAGMPPMQMPAIREDGAVPWGMPAQPPLTPPPQMQPQYSIPNSQVSTAPTQWPNEPVASASDSDSELE